MDYQLLVVRGRSTYETLTLLDGVTTVGRHDACHIRVKSSQVSRKHCELFEKKGILLVKDLGSANGTVVNGERVDGQRVLEPGDELVLGPITLRVAKIGEVPPERRGVTAGAAETAVVEAVAVESGSDEDEFEIDFDDQPTTPSAPSLASARKPAAAPANDDDFVIPFDDDATTPPAPAPTPAPAAPPKPAKAETKKAATPEPVVAKTEADEAIADFLLDIKLDEED